MVNMRYKYIFNSNKKAFTNTANALIIMILI